MSIDPEKWRMACERAGIRPCVKCDSPLHNRLGPTGGLHEHLAHLPELGDAETVLAMLESQDTWKLFHFHESRDGWIARFSDDFHGNGETAAEAIVNACAIRD